MSRMSASLDPPEDTYQKVGKEARRMWICKKLILYPDMENTWNTINSITMSKNYLNMNIYIYIYTLWLFNIAMENGPFIDGLPIKNGDFPWLC